jgi:hypothetical protein
MRDVADLVDRVGTGERAQRVSHELEILALFDRCRSLHRAVLLLLSQQGLVHEAIILGRPLFTDSLALAELAAADDARRGSLAVGWALKSEQQLRAYFLDRRSRGHDADAELQASDRRQRRILEYAADHGYGRSTGSPTTT